MSARIPAFAVVLSMTVVKAAAVIFASTGSTTFNTSEPGGVYAGSGWQYQGSWQGLTGIPIAPNYFVTAEHISVASMSFTFGGVTYAVDDLDFDPNSDLAIGHIIGNFPMWAPLYTGSSEVGKEMVVFGRGTQRGAAISLGGSPRGWMWGPNDLTLRWGTNTVESVADGGPLFGNLLTADFDADGSANEGTLSLNDSGGGIFIKDTDGIWKLAGINFSVDGPYYTDSQGSGGFNAALFDPTGYFLEADSGGYVPAEGPGSLYATRISSNMDFIEDVTGVPEPASGVGLVMASGMAMVGWRRRRG